MVQVKRLGVVLEPKGAREGYAMGGREYAVFNAGAVLKDGEVHMLYRCARKVPNAQWCPVNGYPYQEDWIGHAVLTPEGKLVKDYGKVIAPENEMDFNGTQDPRIVLFEGKYYITYCAYGKDKKARLGFAVTEDFVTYKKLAVLDMPWWNKDHFIFPQRINGKVCLVHRIEPNIYMDFFDDIESMCNQDNWVNYDKNRGDSIHMKGIYDWESLKIGGSVPPIYTPEGWLFIYHGVSWKDEKNKKFQYCAGAALLDLKDPSKVIGRLPDPLLVPETDYELYGDVDNVVFPVGGYIYNGELYISYGGADTVVAMAKVNVDELLTELKKYKA